MSNELIHIGNTDIVVKEYRGKRVVTFRDIDIVHKRPIGTANKRFLDNRKHFIEGEDYFVVSNSEIRKNRMFPISENDFSDKALITEQGYLMLVKSFTDDLAWEVQRQLVNGYFRAKEQSQFSLTLQALTNVVEEFKSIELKQIMLEKKVDEQSEQHKEEMQQIRQDQKEIKQEQEVLTDTFQKVEDIEHFQKWANTCITKIAESPKFTKGDKRDQKYSFARAESYERLSEKRPCRLDLKVENAKERAKRRTPDITKTELNKINKLYVIANDKDLKPSYELVLKEMMVYYCVTNK